MKYIYELISKRSKISCQSDERRDMRRRDKCDPVSSDHKIPEQGVLRTTNHKCRRLESH